MTQKDNNDQKGWPAERRSAWAGIYGLTLACALLFVLMLMLDSRQTRQILELRTQIRELQNHLKGQMGLIEGPAVPLVVRKYLEGRR